MVWRENWLTCGGPAGRNQFGASPTPSPKRLWRRRPADRKRLSQKYQLGHCTDAWEVPLPFTFTGKSLSPRRPVNGIFDRPGPTIHFVDSRLRGNDIIDPLWDSLGMSAPPRTTSNFIDEGRGYLCLRKREVRPVLPCVYGPIIPGRQRRPRRGKEEQTHKTHYNTWD